MTKEEIITGLKNALDRGESIQKASSSMLMTGYNPNDVQEAVENLNMGYSGLQAQTPPVIQIQKALESPAQKEKNEQTVTENIPIPSQIQKPKNHKRKIIFIILIILLFLFMGALAALIIYGEAILNALNL